MKRIRFGSGFIVFVLFFGVAVLEALQTRSWLRVVFWFAMGLVFLIADNRRSENKQEVH